jgi:hypothetical protein
MENRFRKRYTLDCPVTVEVLSGETVVEIERGQLLDIGLGGARFELLRRLAPGTHVCLDLHPPAAPEAQARIRFKGVVTRSQEMPPHEIAVCFQGRGRLLRARPSRGAVRAGERDSRRQAEFQPFQNLKVVMRFLGGD